MSGLKVTDYALLAAMRERQQRLDEVNRARRQVTLAEQRLSAALRRCSEGLRADLGELVTDAEQWLLRQRTEPEFVREWTLNSPTPAMATAARRIEALGSQGDRLATALTRAVTRAERVRGEVAQRLAGLSAALAVHEEVIGRRLGEARQAALAAELAEVVGLASAERVASAEQRLPGLAARVTQAVEEAQTLEAVEGRREQLTAWHRDRAEVETVRRTAGALLAGASEGLRGCFPAETAAASGWLAASAAVAEEAPPEESSTVEALTAAADRMARAAKSGRAGLDQLAAACGPRAAELREAAAEQVQAVEALWAASGGLLTDWSPAADSARWAETVAELRAQLEADRLCEVAAPAAELLAELTARQDVAESLETKHQRRLYVTRAVQRVCERLGFRVVEKPAFEREGDPHSRIRLQVDTFNHGRVTFHISLDEIISDSGIGTNHCLTEFNRLSEELAEQFGVQTKFRSDTVVPPLEEDQKERRERHVQTVTKQHPRP